MEVSWLSRGLLARGNAALGTEEEVVVVLVAEGPEDRHVEGLEGEGGGGGVEEWLREIKASVTLSLILGCYSVTIWLLLRESSDTISFRGAEKKRRERCSASRIWVHFNLSGPGSRQNDLSPSEAELYLYMHQPISFSPKS